MKLPLPDELTVNTLGARRFPSPLTVHEEFVADESTGILVSPRAEDLAPFLESGERPPFFERAGPRSRLFFDPSNVTCGIVTCGGFCPGLNDVIRSIVRTSLLGYGVKRVLGFRYGYAGLAPSSGLEPMELTLQKVDRIHHAGGTWLGSSRGPQDVSEMAETLARQEVDILFTIGGDGTLQGASALDAELRKRHLPTCVVGIPKTIDNDVQWTERTFGFVTAVEAAVKAVSAAHEEARGYLNGVGIVKLMGRLSGFVAAAATLASGDVNFCVVPEFPATLDEDGGLLEAIGRRLRARQHAVVVVAEGAGQEWLEDAAAAGGRDASGNLLLSDVGVFLRDRIKDHFHGTGETVSVKYIDPSYMIRSLPANAYDSAFCLLLGQHAVHAGLAGKTDVMIGQWHGSFVQLPIPLAVESRKLLGADAWQRVLEATGQSA